MNRRLFQFSFTALAAATVLTWNVRANAATIFTEDFGSGLGSWTTNAGSPTTTAPPSAPPDAPLSTLSFVDADGATTRIGRGFSTNGAATSVKLSWYMYSNSAVSTQRYYGQLSAGTAAVPGSGTGTFFRLAANNDANSKYNALYSNGATQTVVTPTSITVGWHLMQLTVTPGAAGTGSFTYQIDANTPVTTVSSAVVVMPTNVQLGQTASNGAAGAPDTSAWFDSLKVEQFAPAAAAATYTAPANLSTGVDPNQDLSWTGGANTTDYNIFFDTNPIPTTLAATQAGTTFDPGTLAAGTTYYWRVDPRNVLGDATAGTVWSFTTAVEVPEPASMGLLGMALLALATAGRRRVA